MMHTIVVEAVNVICGKCGEPIPAKDGSHLWSVHNLPMSGQRVECVSCGAKAVVSRRLTLASGL